MILLLPESRPGFGTGHARRSFEVAQAIEDLGFPAALGAEGSDRYRGLRGLLTGAYGEAEVSRLLPPVSLHPGSSGVSTVVFDSPKVDRGSVRAARRRCLTVGIDAGGPGRADCDYLIDTLPRLGERLPANIASTDFLRMPIRRRALGPKAFTGDPGILVSFGGEDSRRLTERCLRHLQREGVDPGRVTVTIPGGRTVSSGFRVLSSPGSLREELFRFDIVITAFGLTAFEALGAGAEVLLMHPSRYHRRLARRHGFLSLRSVEGRQILQGNPPPGGKRSEGVFGSSGQEWGLPGEIARVSVAGPAACPVCGSTHSPAISRSPGRTHYRCPECTMVFAHRFSDSGIDYDGAYFFEEYRAQYGRSYVDDLPSIIERGVDRLVFLERRTGLRPPKSALDLGCAFGAFLTALAERGYSPYGVDVSPEAVAYCRDQGFQRVWTGDLRDLQEARPFDRESFDLVSLWFVIEHFPDLGRILGLLGDLVDPKGPGSGGLLAFGTPNLAGISGRRDRGGFLKASPADHASVWSPRIARRVLPRFGFDVIATRVTGHHPERFPGAGGVRNGGALWKLLLGVSKIFGLGDTFEVVARRRRDASDA
jgi:SAM-dependent methyltransferase